MGMSTIRSEVPKTENSDTSRQSTGGIVIFSSFAAIQEADHRKTSYVQPRDLIHSIASRRRASERPISFSRRVDRDRRWTNKRNLNEMIRTRYFSIRVSDLTRCVATLESEMSTGPMVETSVGRRRCPACPNATRAGRLACSVCLENARSSEYSSTNHLAQLVRSFVCQERMRLRRHETFFSLQKSHISRSAIVLDGNYDVNGSSSSE